MYATKTRGGGKRKMMETHDLRILDTVLLVHTVHTGDPQDIVGFSQLGNLLLWIFRERERDPQAEPLSRPRYFKQDFYYAIAEWASIHGIPWEVMEYLDIRTCQWHARPHPGPCIRGLRIAPPVAAHAHA